MASTQRKIPRNVLVVALVALASGFGQDLITPVLPLFLVSIGVSHAGIGLIDGLLQGAASISQSLSGVLSDYFRKRKFFVFIGYAFSSVARPLLALAGSFGSVAALRLIDGIGKGTKSAPRDALLADSAPPQIRGRAFGFHRLVDTAGSVMGPIIAAGLLLTLSSTISTYRFIFALAAIPGAIALALIMFGLREPRPAALTKNKPTAVQLPWQFWIFTAVSTLLFLTRVTDSLFLLRAQGLGITRSLIPILFAGFTFFYAILSYPIGIWSDRIGRLPLIIGGWALLGIIELFFSVSQSLLVTLLLFATYGLFLALTEGSGRAVIADFVPKASRGSAYAIFHTSTGLALIAGGYTLGKLWDNVSPEFTFAVAGIGALIGSLLLIFFLLVKPKATLTHQA